MTSGEKSLCLALAMAVSMLLYQLYQDNVLSQETAAAKQKEKDIIEMYELLKKTSKEHTDSLEQQLEESIALWNKAVNDTGKVNIKYVQTHNSIRALNSAGQDSFLRSRLPVKYPY